MYRRWSRDVHNSAMGGGHLYSALSTCIDRAAQIALFGYTDHSVRLSQITLSTHPTPLRPASVKRDSPGNGHGNPIEIKLRRAARLLEVTFEDGSRFELPFQYLRVYSPSAEVKGHGPGQETLVLGKEAVGIRAVEPVGQYAVKLVFDDGHDTGLYTWKYLYELGRDRDKNWSRYLARVEALKPSWQK